MADQDAVLDGLRALAARIEDAQADLTAAYAERLDLFKRGVELGLPHHRLGDASGVTAMAVSYALGEDRRKQEAAKKAARAKLRRARKTATG